MKPSELLKDFLANVDADYEGSDARIKHEQELNVELRYELRAEQEKYSSLSARLTSYLLIKYPQIAKGLHYVLNTPAVITEELAGLALDSALEVLNGTLPTPWKYSSQSVQSMYGNTELLTEISELEAKLAELKTKL